MTALTRLARLHARASVIAHRALAASDGFVAGVLDGGLSIADKSRLGVELYDAAPHYREEGALFDWEERWFERRLSPQSRVLVGACGAGREVCALLERGHVVSGFEPAPSLLELAKSRAPTSSLWLDTYESWSASARGTVNAAEGGTEKSGGKKSGSEEYDAVLLGWGSLSHVLDPAARRALLEACVRVCPTGPILLSYWPRATNPSAARARKLGAQLGQRLGRGVPLGDAYRPNIGFIHMFSRDELQTLADTIGRELVFEGGPADYSHASLLSAGTSA